MKRMWHLFAIAAAVAMSALFASPASAADTIGGHFGAVIPLVSRDNGTTTTVSDDFSAGFPMGVTVKRDGGWAFDLELVPVVQNKPLFVSLTVHPGVVKSLAHGYAAGVRMAFDAKAASWGFTPLVNHAFPVPGHSYVWFVEGVVPVRFQNDSAKDVHTSVGLGAHLGVGF